MKNIVALVALLVLVLASKSYAVEREAQYIREGETYFEKVGATGNQTPGNPGYAILTTTDANGVNYTYYLWVSMVAGTGKLMMASYGAVSPYSSFPLGDWRSPPFVAGTVVGSQS